MHVMDTLQERPEKISRKPGGRKLFANRIIQLSAAEGKETVLKDSMHKSRIYGYNDKYFPTSVLYQQRELENTVGQGTMSPNSRPQSSISNYSNYSLEGEMKEKDLQSLVQKLSMISHPLCRVNALNLLIDSSVPTLVSSALWSDISEQIKLCLIDRDILIFQSSFKLISNIISNSITIREGFLVLLESCLQMGHRKLSPNFKVNKHGLEKSMPYYTNPDKIISDRQAAQVQFSSMVNGINLENTFHKRILRMIQLLVQAQKQMSKYWIRWKEIDIQDILENYIDFISIQVEYTKAQKDKISLLHILSILDPNALWLEYWLFNLHVAHCLIKIIKKNYIYFSFIIHVVLEYLHYSPKETNGDVNTKNTIHETKLRLCLFLHCLNALGLLLQFEKIHELFPISTKTSKKLTLQEFLNLLIRYLNEHRQYGDINRSWYHPVEAAIVKILTNLLIRHTDMIPVVTNVILEPLQKISALNFSNNSKLNCLKVLKQIAVTKMFQNMLLQKQNNVNGETEYMGNIKENCFLDGPRKNRIVQAYTKFDESDDQTPSMIILNFMKRFLQQCSHDQKLSNAEILVDLLTITMYFIETPKCSKLLADSIILDSVIKCYKLMHKQSNLTNDIHISNVLQITDKLLMKLYCTAIGQPRIENHYGIISTLVKRMINKPKFSCLDANFMILISHLGSSAEIQQLFESHNLFQDILLDLWSGINYAESGQFANNSYNNEGKLQGILNVIHSMTCNLKVVQASMQVLCSNPCKSECSLGASEQNFPTTLTGLMTHLCRNDGNCEIDPESIADLTELEKKSNSSEHIEKHPCTCITSSYELTTCFVALEILKALITNLDVMLYLNVKYKFQDNLLLAQSANTRSTDQTNITEADIQEEYKDLKSNLQIKSVIIDELSIIRHQILLSSGYLGGPKESAPRNYDLDRYLNDATIPRLFSEWPNANFFQVRRSSSYFGRRNFLEEFLWKTKSNPNDGFWVKKAREKLKHSEDIKNIVLVELLNAAPKECKSPIRLLELTMKSEFRNVQMFEEDFMGIDLIIRYGIDMNILRDETYHKKNLTYMMQLCYKSFMRENRTEFGGFDWFVGVVFIICKGNVIRCRKFLQMFINLPCAPFLWRNFGEALSERGFGFSSESLPAKFALMHGIELLMEDNVIERNILQYNGVSWPAITQCWLQQCFLNIIDWGQLIRLFACCILYPADFLAYYSVTMLNHLSDVVRENASRKNLWQRIKLDDMIEFSIDNYYTQIEDMRQKYQHTLLPLMQYT